VSGPAIAGAFRTGKTKQAKPQPMRGDIIAGAAPESVGPFDPIGHGARAKPAAMAAPHARAEGRHLGVIRPVVQIDRALVAAMPMAALPAGHKQATYAVLPHVAERHPADRFVVLSHPTS
jgi:hypothetical protein